MKTRALLIVLLIVLVSAGCEEEVGSPPGNITPRTYLSIVGADFDTTDYRKILHWWGTDIDGEVSAYLIRWDGGWLPPSGTGQIYDGLTYSRTTATTDTFNVPLGGTFGRRTFMVRAIDDQELVDPEGVSQEFPLHNYTPMLAWNPALPRPSRGLPAAAFGWNPTDFDGRETVTTFRVWLDGDSTNVKTFAGDTIVALFPDDFGERIDTERTVFVQAIDDAQAVSNTISHTWYVESPQADWLLIDQITGPGASQWDRPFYFAVLDSIVGGSFYTYDLVDGPDFITVKEVEPLLSLFRGVVWVAGPYRDGNDARMARNLRTAEKAITAYVQGGGKVFISGQTVIGHRAGLSPEFAQEMLGIPEYYRIRIEPEGTTITDIGMDTGTPIFFDGEGQPDSLQAESYSPRVDYFVSPVGPGIGRYWVAPGVLEQIASTTPIPPQDTEPAYLGVVAHHGDGTICLVTNSYARFFPRQGGYEGDWSATIGEGVRLFREVLSP